jgi:hypothetical protein
VCAFDFPAAEIQEAYRYMQKGQHIGRVTIALTEDGKNSSSLFDTTPRP